MSTLCAIDLEPIVGVLLGIAGVIIGWYLLFVVGFVLIRAPLVTVAALVKGEVPEEGPAWVASFELVALVIFLIVHFHIVKWG